MSNRRCLYCYEILDDKNLDFHPKCSQLFFGSAIPPVLAYGNEQMQELAKEIVIRSVAITGVQPKLSLTIEPSLDDPKRSRFTVVGLWGGYILKPPTNVFPQLPENEDLTMHLSELFGIPTALHTLIRLQSGELAYLTKRFDRIEGTKLAMEDMCQLTETLTSDKYRSSMEKVGKHIAKYSMRPGIDLLTFFEMALFCFLTGNADMHLKNFSLLTSGGGEVALSPAYDLVCTTIAMPDDKEETGLTINAKKRKLDKKDFDILAQNLKIPTKAMEHSYENFAKKINESCQLIDISFLSEANKNAYKTVIITNAKKIGLI